MSVMMRGRIVCQFCQVGNRETQKDNEDEFHGGGGGFTPRRVYLCSGSLP